MEFLIESECCNYVSTTYVHRCSSMMQDHYVKWKLKEKLDSLQVYPVDPPFGRQATSCGPYGINSQALRFHPECFELRDACRGALLQHC